MKNYLINSFTQNLKSKIEINKINISFFKQFPKISLELDDIKISDPLSEKRILLQAKQIDIGFNIYDMLTKNYDIKLVTVDSGNCNIIADRSGKYNFYIFKDDSTSTNKNLFININELKINNVLVKYVNYHSSKSFDVLLHEMKINGSFTNNLADLKINGKLIPLRIKPESMNFVKDKNISVDFIMAFNSDNEKFTFKKGDFKIAELPLKADGFIINNPENFDIDINFIAPKISIPELFSILPFKNEILKNYESSGEIYFRGNTKGLISSSENPAIGIEFGIKDGILKKKLSLFSIQNINLAGTFSNGKKHSSESSFIEIKKFSSQIKNGEVKGNFVLNDFTNPLINSTISGDIDANDLIHFTENKTISNATGKINFELHLNGKINDFTSKQNWNKTYSKGSAKFKIENILFANSTSKIQNISGEISLLQNDIFINSFNTKIGESDIDLKGKMLNVIPYLFLNNQKLEASININSNTINLEDIAIPMSTDTIKKTGIFQLPNSISLTSAIKINTLKFHEFNAANMNANFNWKDKTISLENISCETMHGKLTGTSQVENAADGRFLSTSSFSLENINLNEMLKECRNFGQNELTDKFVFGTLTTKIDVVSVWSPSLDCDLSKLYSFADLKIINGEIINYKPLEKLSKYADVEDLRHLRFAELNNKIEIKNKTITIPSMEIKNNALNLALSGNHTFDNIVDYKLKIKLSELLKKKRKPQTNEFGEEDESGKGLYLYLTMKGPIDNPKFSYDKVSVKNKIKQDLKVEKENVKEALKKELGIGKDTTIHEKQTDSKEVEFEKE